MPASNDVPPAVVCGDAPGAGMVAVATPSGRPVDHTPRNWGERQVEVGRLYVVEIKPHPSDDRQLWVTVKTCATSSPQTIADGPVRRWLVDEATRPGMITHIVLHEVDGHAS